MSPFVSKPPDSPEHDVPVQHADEFQMRREIGTPSARDLPNKRPPLGKWFQRPGYPRPSPVYQEKDHNGGNFITVSEGVQQDTFLLTPGALNDLNEVRNLAFRPLEPIRTDVRYPHALGNIQGDHDIHPFLMHLLVVASPTGAGQGQDHQAKGPQQKRRLQYASSFTRFTGQSA